MPDAPAMTAAEQRWAFVDCARRQRRLAREAARRRGGRAREERVVVAEVPPILAVAEEVRA